MHPQHFWKKWIYSQLGNKSNRWNWWCMQLLKRWMYLKPKLKIFPVQIRSKQSWKRKNAFTTSSSELRNGFKITSVFTNVAMKTWIRKQNYQLIWYLVDAYEDLYRWYKNLCRLDILGVEDIVLDDSAVHQDIKDQLRRSKDGW